MTNIHKENILYYPLKTIIDMKFNLSEGVI